MFRNAIRNSMVINQGNTVKDSFNTTINNGVQAEDDERFRILNWLSEVNYEEHHEFIAAARQDNTGNWLFGKGDFTEWERSTSSIFWLHGIAGAGKTVLASTVIDMFKNRMPTNHALAYFYCKYGESDRQDPESILSTIVKQISLLSPAEYLPDAVISRYQDLRKGGVKRRLWVEESTELILQLSQAFDQTVIIVDALDECNKNTRYQLLVALKELRSSTHGFIKVFITSRNDDDIVLQLTGEADVFIQASDNSNDIERFVVAEVNKYISTGRLLRGRVQPKLKHTIIETLTNGANGMFLWVHLQIEHIRLEKTETAIRHALKRLPEGLTATYQVIWEKIHADTEANQRLAERALKWIISAKSPLTEDEILDAVSITPMQWVKRPDHDGVTQMTILDLCQNLLVLDEELGVLRTAHFSVTEFLLKKLDISEAHTAAAEVCLTLLCWENYVNGGRQSEEYVLNNFALRRYVMKNWEEHIRLSSDGSRALVELQKIFFRPSPAYSKWLEAASKYDRGLKLEDSKIELNPLWVACYLRLWDTFKYLLLSSPDCTARNYRGTMPIHLVARDGYGEGMKPLLEQIGVNLNAKNDNGWSPLYIAALYGHEEVVRLLIAQEGVDLNAKS
ncbi:hypothetical protein RUND412_011463, partial [Rhizina undulata]